jgi:4-amino-4-deoxy-L-arabinose transferase-like glycosyltransferase
VKVVNAALGAAAIALAGLLARRLGGDRAGLVAAGILAFLPRALLMTCLVASENLFSPLFLAFAWVLIESFSVARSGRYAAGGGLLVGLAALTRTVAYYVGPIWLLGALFAGKKWRRAVGETLLVLAVQHAVMLPWALRNLRDIGRLSFLNTAGGYGLYLGNNPKATGNWYEGLMDLERISPGVIARGPVAVSDLSNELAWKWIRENPGPAFRLYLVKFGIIFRQTFIVASFAVNGAKVTPPFPGIDVLPGDHFLKSHGRLLNGTLWATGWLLVLVGASGWLILAARAVRSRRAFDVATALVLPAVTLYVPLTSALIAVNGRYRWPVEDLLVPAAALALAAGARRRARSSEPRPA